MQLPTPYILFCNFNSHNAIWKCKTTNQKSRTLKNIISNNNLCLLNTCWSIFCYLLRLRLSPLWPLNFSRRIYKDTCGTHHFPIVIESIHLQVENLPRWKLNKACWEEFRSQCFKHLIQNNNTYSANHLTQKLITIVKTCIPYNLTSYNQDKLWFHTELTISNLISFKFYRVNACKTIKETKGNSW